MKQRDYTYFLPQSEKEWLESGRFEVDDVIVNDTSVRVAHVLADEPERLVVMSGGVPRDEARREKLPLINKLYGHLGILLAGDGSNSLLYNQPGTGNRVVSLTHLLSRIVFRYWRTWRLVQLGRRTWKKLYL